MQLINDNLKTLYSFLKKKKNDYYFISTSDEYLNEYVPNYNMRLKWLTNFSGSNGYALISEKKNFFFTDGRYLQQANKELPKNFKIFDLNKENLINFFYGIKNKKVLTDTKCFSKDVIIKISKNLQKSNSKLIHDKKNLIDSIWLDRPIEQIDKFFILEKKKCGQSFEEKLKKIRPLGNNILVITSPESLCWLLNIRGYDLENTPLVFCRAIITKKKIEFYVNKKKIPKGFISTYKSINVYDISSFDQRLKKLNQKNIQVDNQLSYFFFKTLEGNKLLFKDDPCKILKSQKNKIEILQSRSAHLNDGVALVKFYFWLEENFKKNNITEFEAAKKLEVFRKEGTNYFSSSFPTISATGANGSIVHYKPNKKSSVLKKGELYLCDSGGQYYGATTDITRTIYLGDKPSETIKSIYTKVLLGHLNISMLKFPVGTRGYQLDSIARYNLWNHGLDYNHGTGHGVGSFLGVHEGPQSISKNPNDVSLKPGMIISNEPGFYKNKSFGIRIENLVLVKKSLFKNFFEFETLSLFPYELKLISFNLLNNTQKDWIRKYHNHVYSKVSNLLDKKHCEWLKRKIEMSN